MKVSDYHAGRTARRRHRRKILNVLGATLFFAGASLGTAEPAHASNPSLSPDAVATAFETLNRALLVDRSGRDTALSRAVQSLPAQALAKTAGTSGLESEVNRLKAMASAIEADPEVVDVEVLADSVRTVGSVKAIQLHVIRTLRDGVVWEEIQPVAIVQEALGELRPGQVYSLDWDLVAEGAVPKGLVKLLNLQSGQAYQDQAASESEGKTPGSDEGVTASAPGTGSGSVSQFKLPSAGKTKVVNYALKYALNYNAAYHSYEGNYADCTNFISQALLEGGWTEVLGFYTWDSVWWVNEGSFLPPYNSYTWSGAENWYKFARNESGRVSALSAVDSTVIGDMVQFKDPGATNMTHSMVVTKKSGSTTYVSGHTPNVKNKLASSYNKAGRIWFAHRT